MTDFFKGWDEFGFSSSVVSHIRLDPIMGPELKYYYI
jgi:hypothetical protein